VEQALQAITDADHVKLMLIARAFCKSRKLSTGAIEPEELLSEAILKTCQMDKQWNKAISFVRHLDRAMENISGHLVRERTKIVPFQDGLSADKGQGGANLGQEAPDNSLAVREETQALLKNVFGDDEPDSRVFVLRAEGFNVPEILSKLHLSDSQYEAIGRRIRRKISKFLKQTTQL
jgi:DNA-directed RNA polymerase specialized sigma24 family protein